MNDHTDYYVYFQEVLRMGRFVLFCTGFAGFVWWFERVPVCVIVSLGQSGEAVLAVTWLLRQARILSDMCMI